MYICDAKLHMRKKVTIKDIAKELNTASSTVSRALNNLPGVGEARRLHILNTAKALGYEPNLLAQQLRKGHSNTIGLIVPQINRQFFANVIHSIEMVAKEKGFNVLISQSNESDVNERDSMKALIASNVAGIIMSVSAQARDLGPYLEVLEKQIPLVMFDRTLNNLDVHNVINDNELSAYNAVTHLIEQGYRHIVHFAGPQHLDIYSLRLKGYKRALRDHGLPFEPTRVLTQVNNREAGKEAARMLLENNIRFDAIHAASDYSALGAMLYLRKKGIQVPQQVGIVGCANEPFTELIGLSSIEQYSEEVGKAAARLLFEDIELQAERPVSKKISFTPTLIIRESSKKIN